MFKYLISIIWNLILDWIKFPISSSLLNNEILLFILCTKETISVSLSFAIEDIKKCFSNLTTQTVFYDFLSSQYFLQIFFLIFREGIFFFCGILLFFNMYIRYIYSIVVSGDINYNKTNQIRISKEKKRRY